MGLHGESSRRVLRHAMALLLGVALATGTGACKRDPGGQLPAASGEAIQAKREAIKGFALLRAYPDQRRDDLAIAQELIASGARVYASIAPSLAARRGGRVAMRRPGPDSAAAPCRTPR